MKRKNNIPKPKAENLHIPPRFAITVEDLQALHKSTNTGPEGELNAYRAAFVYGFMMGKVSAAAEQRKATARKV